MRTLSVILFCAAFIAAAAKPIGEKQKFHHIQVQASYPSHPNDGVVGVATVAGITSRNGRVSSLGGVKFYPRFGDMVTNGELLYPLTVSAEKDGRYTTGSVHVYPKLFVSTSARAGSGPAEDLQRPFKDFFLQPPPELFAPTNLDNFLPNDFFKSLPPRPDLRSGWLYPGFNPFMNFWR